MDWIESRYSSETAMRFARSGAMVRIITAEDACEVCKAMAGRVYVPSDVPRLPIRGCLREQCRCHFVAVDPETELTVPQLVQWGVRVLKEGRTELARRILRRAVTLDDMHESGWLWLSGVVDDEEKVACLEKVLAINPQNQRAKAGLELLRKKPVSPETVRPEPGRERAMPIPADRQEQTTAQPISTEPQTSTIPVPPQVVDLREERQVILEQWINFISFAVDTDAQTLLTQGSAFLGKLDDLYEQALDLLAPEMHLGELGLQWKEFEEALMALRSAFQVHHSRREELPGWQDMDRAIRDLTQQVLDRRDALRAQISAIGGEMPET